MVHLVQRPRIVPLVQSGWVRAASSNKLVPGDVVVVTKGRVTCDMVLLRGSCIAQESMLSGEVGLRTTHSWILAGCVTCTC